MVPWGGIVDGFRNGLMPSVCREVLLEDELALGQPSGGQKARQDCHLADHSRGFIF